VLLRICFHRFSDGNFFHCKNRCALGQREIAQSGVRCIEDSVLQREARKQQQDQLNAELRLRNEHTSAVLCLKKTER